MRKILFISEIRDPYTSGYSTQIMTKNIMKGLRENCDIFHAVLIAEIGCDLNNILQYYGQITDKITAIHSDMNLVKYERKKYTQLAITIKAVLNSHHYMKLAEKLAVDDSTILISHSPSIESILICNELKKKNKSLKYIQYWSDPIAISGIYPEKFSFKRYPSYIIEKSLLAKADKVVYGTKTLMDSQKKVFNNYAHKMDYIDVSYSSDNIISENKKKERLIFGYSGDYMQEIRNILPLYNAFTNNQKADLWIYGNGTPELSNTDHIIIHQRCPQSEIPKIEAEIDVLICLLNHSCIQIPGKVFYQTNTNKIILVILDGKYAEDIRAYLESFNRFEFCYNNEKSINTAVDKICRGDCKVDLSCLEKLSPKYITAKLCELKY